MQCWALTLSTEENGDLLLFNLMLHAIKIVVQRKLDTGRSLKSRRSGFGVQGKLS